MDILLYNTPKITLRIEDDETGWQLCSTLEKIHEVIEELRTEVNMYFTTDKILEVSGEMSEALFEEKKRTSIIKSNGSRLTEKSRNEKAAGQRDMGLCR